MATMKFLVVAMILAVILSIHPSTTLASGRGRSVLHELEVDGVARNAIFYRPPLSVAAESEKLPLMIVLHGGLGNAASMQRRSGMDAVADKGRFMVAYPNGTGTPDSPDMRTWNAGRCCGQAVRKQVNDVLFIENLIDEAASRFHVDTTRVYVAGFSNGAMLAYRLACEIPERIAAIIPVAGTLAVDRTEDATEVAVLHIHGDSDSNVPFNGGMGARSMAGVSHRSVPDTAKLMTAARRCSGVTEEDLEGGIQSSSYRCTMGAPFELLLLKNGGHEWPSEGTSTRRNSWGRHFCASAKAWEFARQFTKTASGGLIHDAYGSAR